MVGADAAFRSKSNRATFACERDPHKPCADMAVLDLKALMDDPAISAESYHAIRGLLMAPVLLPSDGEHASGHEKRGHGGSDKGERAQRDDVFHYDDDSFPGLPAQPEMFSAEPCLHYVPRLAVCA